ncbi:MAG: hypothetical protein COS84_07225 [Armatimonadetes bacterium CG07_land_8_20_14_0_80_40_9]|nr:MAG: hypothetical protein COS84_07225 [Armatimonadetes bacterium CG07_land_8_20_14_0_80_40_9]
MLRKRRWLILPLVVLLALSMKVRPGLANGETKEVIAEGVGAIVEGDKARARDQAIMDAKRMAVEQGVGTFVNSETMVENFQVIKDNIYTKASGYIKEYSIIDETPSPGLYRVKIKATVSLAEIKDDLTAIGLLLEEMHMPRMMVIIPEVHLGRPKVPDPAGETEILRKLLEKGFDCVDQSQIKQIRENDQVRAAVNGDNKAAILLGLEYGAEVVIIGEAFSEFNTEMAGMYSCRARVEARAIQTDTGKILATNGLHAGGADATENTAGKVALKNAGALMGDYLIEQILKKWKKESVGARTIQIVAKVRNYKQLGQFKSALKNLRGYKNLHQRSFAANVAKLDLEIALSTGQDLADEISGLKIAGGEVEVTNFTANRIDVVIK